jgi:hypothetical protein
MYSQTRNNHRVLLRTKKENQNISKNTIDKKRKALVNLTRFLSEWGVVITFFSGFPIPATTALLYPF